MRTLVKLASVIFLASFVAITGVLASCTDRDATPETVSVAESFDSTDAWRGQWNGPEGTFLLIEGKDGRYKLTIQNLDGPQTYAGSSTGAGIQFASFSPPGDFEPR